MIQTQLHRDSRQATVCERCGLVFFAATRQLDRGYGEHCSTRCRKYRTPEQILALVRKDSASACWPWPGRVHTDGYGRTSTDGRRGQVHRITYALVKGSIPEGLELDHLCRNRACANPNHLEAVTSRVNLLRGVGAAAQNARKTECKRGHSLVGANCYVNAGSGFRQCRRCKALHAQAKRDGRKLR